MTSDRPPFAVVRRGPETLFSRARVARTPLQRMLGLLPRVGLEADEALVFPRCRSLHTFLMRFPIDVAFVRETGEVVKLFFEVASGRVLLGGRGAHSAIECGAAVLRGHGVDVGQRLTWNES